MSRRLPFAIALAAAVLATSCASTRGLQPATTPSDPASYALTRSLAGVALSDAAFPQQDWWRALGDPQLDGLIDEALRGTPSLAAADARVRKAQAQAGIADAARKPSVGASAQYALAELPEGLAGDEIGGKVLRNAVLMLKLDVPLDVWGGKRAQYEAALDQAHALQIDAQAARLTLAANVARSYVALAQAFEAQDLAQREQARCDALTRLQQQRVDAGIDNRMALRSTEAQHATAKAQADAAQQQIDSLRNTLAALLGQGPDRGLAIQRPRLLHAAAPVLPSVLPSELLGHRPDVVAARWRVEAAAQGIASAKASFKPSIDLSALAGLASTGFSDLFRSDALLGFGGPALSLPIFDGGRLRNNLAAHDADYELAVADYDATAVQALREVVDALQAIRALDAQAASVEQAHASASAALALVNARRKAGMGSQLDVLAAQKPLLQLDQQLAGLRAQRYAAGIDLDRALGGGLVVTTPTPTTSAASPDATLN